MRSPDNQIRLPFRHSPHHNKIIYKHTEIWTSIYIFSFHLWSVISCNWSIDDARWFENKLQMYWRLVLRRWLDSSDKNITIIFFVIWFYSIADHYLSIKTNNLVYHIKLLSISTISELLTKTSFQWYLSTCNQKYLGCFYFATIVTLRNARLVKYLENV